MKGNTWVRSADHALALAVEHIKVIRAVTPKNADSELIQLEQGFRRGSPRLPRWEYEAAGVSSELRVALDKLAGYLDAMSPLGQVYAARARELCLEAAIIDSVGTPRLRARAEERFVGRTDEARSDLETADRLAATWTEETLDPLCDGPRSAEDARSVRTCDADDPSSLISRMSSEAGRHRLPMRVILQAGLASLAATGDGVILVAIDRRIGVRDVERTVLHEIAGHALPRARAASEPFGIFAIGTACGIDDQEGRALLIEESAGFLDGPRRRELGFRHIAARATLGGANMVDLARLLVAKGARIEDAFRIAARVSRGGNGLGGLAREIVYLPALLRVRRALADENAAVTAGMMERGRIAVHVAPVVANETKGMFAYPTIEKENDGARSSS